jgi:hypothetical protein
MTSDEEQIVSHIKIAYDNFIINHNPEIIDERAKINEFLLHVISLFQNYIINSKLYCLTHEEVNRARIGYLEIINMRKRLRGETVIKTKQFGSFFTIDDKNLRYIGITQNSEIYWDEENCSIMMIAKEDSNVSLDGLNTNLNSLATKCPRFYRFLNKILPFNLDI